MAGMVGAFSEVTMDDEDRNLLMQCREQAQQVAGEEFRLFEPESVSRQIVAGTNYRFTVKVDDDRRVVVKIFVPLPYTGNPPQVTSVEAA